MYVKERKVQHIYGKPIVHKIKNIGWLSMYANCIQLPTNVVSINGLTKNLPCIPSITLVSVNDVVDAIDSYE